MISESAAKKALIFGREKRYPSRFELLRIVYAIVYSSGQNGFRVALLYQPYGIIMLRKLH